MYVKKENVRTRAETFPSIILASILGVLPSLRTLKNINEIGSMRIL